MSEITEIGALFVGIATLIVTILIVWIAYSFFRRMFWMMDSVGNRDMRYEIYECYFLDKMAKDKGINMKKEILELKAMTDLKNLQPKSFRKRVEQKIIEDAFGKVKDEDKDKK